MDYALEIKGMKKHYKNFELDNIDIKLPKGKVIGLIGENGAGKSTTMKAALELIHKDAGEVLFWGKRLSDNNREIKEKLGIVFDEINFYQTLTPGKVGNICKEAYRNWDRDLYCRYLEKFELPVNKEIKTFSKGMQVKLCLAAALSHHARLLLLDEPTSGLDPVIRDDILDVFLEFVQDEENSILLSSHITNDLEKIADYIVFIHKGKIILNENKDNLIYNYGIIRCGLDDFSKLDKKDILAYRKMDYQWDVLVKDKRKAQVKYKDSVIDTATLEDIMLLYVKGETV